MPQSTKNIAILMATYNGEKYLREQLQSLYNQTYTDWTLYIGDDGSSDGTASIVREFSQRYGNIVFHQNSEGKGAMRNFMDLLAEAEADYYMFCDQDDVWLPGKVEQTLRAMEEQERKTPGKPILVFTDLKVTDENLHVTSPSFWHSNRIKPKLLSSLNYLGVHFLATGCTMMLNNPLKQLAFPYPDTAYLHDAWITLKAVTQGGILCPLADAQILYRQHGSNVAGSEDLRRNYILHRLATITTVVRNNIRVYKLASNFNYGSWLKYLYYKVLYYFKELHS